MILSSGKIFLSMALIPIIFGVNSSAQTPGLKSVQIIFRHGERTADTSFVTPTAGLTELGKKQMYELGLYIRKRYSTLIKTEFDTDETSIISSDTDRTVRSAALVAHGLYKDFNLGANWKAEKDPKPFEPIPVRTIPPRLDRYLQPKVSCPRLDQLMETTVVPFFNDLVERNTKLINTYVRETNDNDFLNKNNNMENRIVKLVSFLEQAEFNSTYGLPLRDWTVEMLELDDFRFFISNLNKNAYKLPEEKKLYGGSLLGLVTSGFKDKTYKTLTLYSGHDRVLYVLMEVLGIYDPSQQYMPPLGASLIFELHQDSRDDRQGEEHVKVFYRNDTQVEPQELKMSFCKNPCLLSEFLKSTKNMIPVNYEEECQA